MDAASDVARFDLDHRGGERRLDPSSNGHDMLWVPPPHWFIIAFLALLTYLIVIGRSFYRHGWKRGLVSIPVSLFAFVISVIGGTIMNAVVWFFDPVPLVMILTLFIYLTHRLMCGPIISVSEG